MNRLFFAALVLTGNAIAADLAARVAEAKAAAASPEGAAYERSLAPQFGSAMQSCIPAGSTAEANLGAFVLVGSVSVGGELMHVQVEPSTRVSICFAEQLQRARLPVPPKSGASPSGFPVVVEMRVEK